MIGKFAKGLVNGFLGGLAGGANTPQGKRNIITNAASVTGPGKTHYWTFMPPKKGKLAGSLGDMRKLAGFGPAPRLAPWSTSTGPASLDDYPSDATGPSTHINIRDSHHWTESPVTSRGEVPFLSLKEYKILANPMLNQMINNVAVAVQLGAETLDTAGKMAAQATELIGKISADGVDVKKEIANAQRRIEDLSTQDLQDEQTDQFSDPLEPYKLMYMTAPTKFKYTMPYMENSFRSIQNSMGEGGSDGKQGLLGIVDSLAGAATEIMGDISGRTLVNPGVQIEKPKSFSFTGREKSYTVRFPLFNTKSYEEIIKNWEFLYLLIYQNTPNRITKDLIDPPCIYEAKIPGVWYSKYACITNLTIEYVGARREMPIEVLFIDSSNSNNTSDGTGSTNWQVEPRTINTVIPDAYQVSLTVQELFSETQNFLYHMLRESSDNQVTVGKKSNNPINSLGI